MLSEFLVYLRLGFEHIADIRGYDHILFVVALCAGYEPRQWRKILVLVTAFTVGHSITLALATLRLISISTDLVEFLIPLTIFVTGVFNIVVATRGGADDVESRRARFLKYCLALGFGLIHGMGFSNFLRAVLGAEESIALPLFAFNVGLEVGQICIVLVVLLLTFAIVHWVRMRRHDWILVLSGAAAGVAVTLMAERFIG
ncbi:MAG: HupE/UreJ family protein [Gemmatimonadetes bacterium]|nr:HupE/UreJ family protein [Gemmatimonadota bacterium]